MTNATQEARQNKIKGVKMEELTFNLKSPFDGRVIEAHLTEETAKTFDIATMQASIYTMLEGGMLGDFAIRQPADFHIDDKVGRLPYPKKLIHRAVQILCFVAKAQGCDTHHLPDLTKRCPYGWFFDA